MLNSTILESYLAHQSYSLGVTALLCFSVPIVLSIIKTKKNNHHYKNLPRSYPGTFLFGNIFQFVGHGIRGKLHEFMLSVNKFDSVARVSIPGLFPKMVIIDRADLFKSFINHPDIIRGDQHKIVFEGIAPDVLAPTGPVHKRNRKLLVSSLSPEHIREGIDASNFVINRLFDSWDRQCESGKTEFCLMDQLNGKVAFSYDYELTKHTEDGVSKDNSIIKNFEKMMQSVMLRFSMPSQLWPFFGVSASQLKPLINKLYLEMEKSIASKKALRNSLDHQEGGGKKSSMDVLDRIFDHADDSITEQNIKEIVFGIFLGGHDTTSTTLQHVVALLAGRPDVVEKIRKEVDPVWGSFGECGNKNEVVGGLKYVDKVIKEAMRVRSIIGINYVRFCAKDIVLGGYDIPKGTFIMWNAQSVHNNPKYWDSPEVFNPDRWTEDFKPKTGSYIPFGDGQMACPGQKLAMMEMKIILASLFYRYDVEIGKPDMDLLSLVVLSMKSYNIKIKKRII